MKRETSKLPTNLTLLYNAHTTMIVKPPKIASLSHGPTLIAKPIVF